MRLGLGLGEMVVFREEIVVVVEESMAVAASEKVCAPCEEGWRLWKAETGRAFY